MDSTLSTASRTFYTEAQQDTNWEALSSEQRAYFNRLASGDSERTGQAFFEDTVPAELQDNPEKLEVFLNGGTVTTYEWEPARGRAGGEYVEVTHEVPDRDWSHDTSRSNGGSDSADNGRWEEASTNRARGARNTTTSEQQAADEASAYDAELLENGEVLKEAEQAADLVAAVEASELLAVAADVTLDFLAPAVGGAVVAKVCCRPVREARAQSCCWCWSWFSYCCTPLYTSWTGWLGRLPWLQAHSCWCPFLLQEGQSCLSTCPLTGAFLLCVVSRSSSVYCSRHPSVLCCLRQQGTCYYFRD